MAVDATGFDARPVSGYSVRRSGRRLRRRHWPKPTAAVGTATHRVPAAAGTRGPSQDAPHLVPAVRAAAARARVGTVPAGAGYDPEANHVTCRRVLGGRATVIAPDRRGSRKRPKTAYRRRMARRFRRKPRGSRYRRVYGQRWPAESLFSRLGRRLGAAIGAVTWAAQQAEVTLKVIARNIMLLAAGVST